MTINWKEYRGEGFWDEMIRPGGRSRPGAASLKRLFAGMQDDELKQRRAAAEIAIRTMGITFRVYGEAEGGSIDREWPFDLIPRLIRKSEWDTVSAGLKQRVDALNQFIADIYGEQQVLRDGIVPESLILRSKDYRPECRGIKAPHNIWSHICGSDLVRDGDGTLYVLEDNLRVPSGVSYMIENREVMKRVFPEAFENYAIHPVDDYPEALARCLRSLTSKRNPQLALLTPGIFNSAYYEHAYLANATGAQLVEGSDLVVASDDCVYMKTVDGLVQVDVIYRRVDDLFLDPEVFNPDSQLGVPGLMRAWRKGNVALANAPGCGVADDKVVYTYVPDLIRYYLKQEPLLPNVPSWRCVYKEERDYVLEHLDELVVKPANESGGYGMLIGPKASQRERNQFRRQILANPRNYMAQPMLALSTAPTLIGNQAEPRHLDLRPFILSGEDQYVTNGGLTRVAMRKGSIVVNSSQGGGSKDTWIINDA